MAGAAFGRVHTFHIPVMGTGFAIDTALRVAKYGITSTLSLVDDVLIEQMRKLHCSRQGEPYEEISQKHEDARALRITAYLNLLDRLVDRQVDELQRSAFEPGSEITRYYEMLPASPLADAYGEMLASSDPGRRVRMQERLRRLAVPGGIDVNIMSKGDRDAYRDGRKLPPEYSDASAALRGYANSTLRSSIVFSAGMNPRLYSYAGQFPDFLPDESGVLRKKIVLKVTDYHSAAVQGKFLAKRGLWVSEYRVESGLNCGGHAFATPGILMGPVLEEFNEKREELASQLHAVYGQALAARGRPVPEEPYEVRITAQGGIGTAEEAAFLMDYYGVDGTGWATPFLLVPEVTNVDEEHLRKLAEATEDEVYLSDASPFGLPFWNLRNSASEEARRKRIREGKPGSACPKGYVKLFNMEFTNMPICTASRDYQRRKLAHLAEEDLSPEQLDAVRESVLAKSCICHDLGGGVALKNGLDPRATPAICCGPNIVNFSKIATLEEMVGHIYGRTSLLTNPNRPHMFVRELALYVDFLRKEIEKSALDLSSYTFKYLCQFKENLLDGIEYYRRLAGQFVEETRHRFVYGLAALREVIDPMLAEAAV